MKINISHSVQIQNLIMNEILTFPVLEGSTEKEIRLREICPQKSSFGKKMKLSKFQGN